MCAVSEGVPLSPGDQYKAFQTHRTKAALLQGMMHSTCRAQTRSQHGCLTQGVQQHEGLFRWEGWDASHVLC